MNNSIPADVLEKITNEAICAVENAFDKAVFTYPESYCELYERGAIYGFQLRDDEVKLLANKIWAFEKIVRHLTEQEKEFNKRIASLESALHKIMELADDGASLKLIYDGAEEALNK